MRVEYDYDTCIGMFQCVAEWDAFERDEDAELDAKFAARACPVDAIRVYDGDGDQLVP